MEEIGHDTTDVQSEWQRFLENGIGSDSNYVSRRRVLRTGALASGLVLGGGAMVSNVGAEKPEQANNDNNRNNYGNGNAIGAFLNEEAVYKESPVWDTGIADRTGREEVNVLWSGLTEVIRPDTGETVPGPWGVDPRAVKVSPGTEVTWTWYDGEFALDIHHLVSYFDPPYEEEFGLPPELGPGPESEEEEGDDHDHEHPGGEDEFYVKEDPGDSFSYTFDEVGTYFFFCIPHGIPSGELDVIPSNLFGQRGAVKVVDD